MSPQIKQNDLVHNNENTNIPSQTIPVSDSVKPNKGWLYILIALVVLIVVVGGVYYFLNIKSGAKQVAEVLSKQILISGTVASKKGEPMIGTLIYSNANTSTTTTDYLGGYTIKVPSNQEVSLTFKKNGFVPIHRIVNSNMDNTQNITMFNETAFKKVDIYKDINVNMNGAGLSSEANSFIVKGTKEKALDAKISLTPFDPTKTEDLKAFPGEFSGIQANGQKTNIESFGFTKVQVRDSEDRPLDLEPGKTAELTMPISTSQVATAPETIPLWNYDEKKGTWVELGTAYKTCTDRTCVYKGKITTIASWWNCDASWDNSGNILPRFSFGSGLSRWLRSMYSPRIEDTTSPFKFDYNFSSDGSNFISNSIVPNPTIENPDNKQVLKYGISKCIAEKAVDKKDGVASTTPITVEKFNEAKQNFSKMAKRIKGLDFEDLISDFSMNANILAFLRGVDYASETSAPIVYNNGNFEILGLLLGKPDGSAKITIESSRILSDPKIIKVPKAGESWTSPVDYAAVVVPISIEKPNMAANVKISISPSVSKEILLSNNLIGEFMTLLVEPGKNYTINISDAWGNVTRDISIAPLKINDVYVEDEIVVKGREFKDPTFAKIELSCSKAQDFYETAECVMNNDQDRKATLSDVKEVLKDKKEGILEKNIAYYELALYYNDIGYCLENKDASEVVRCIKDLDKDKKLTLEQYNCFLDKKDFDIYLFDVVSYLELANYYNNIGFCLKNDEPNWIVDCTTKLDKDKKITMDQYKNFLKGKEFSGTFPESWVYSILASYYNNVGYCSNITNEDLKQNCVDGVK